MGGDCWSRDWPACRCDMTLTPRADANPAREVHLALHGRRALESRLTRLDMSEAP